MASKGLFSTETVKQFLKDNLILDIKQNFEYLVRECRSNGSILCLNISSELEDFAKEYVMVKKLNIEDFYKKQAEYATEDVFTIQDNKKDEYLLFAKNDFLYPRKNNLEDLNAILRSLAELQVNFLVESKSEVIRDSEYNLKNISDAVISLDFFKSFDKSAISDTVTQIQNSVNELLKNGLVVKTFGSTSAGNVFLTASGKCIFLELGHKEFRSPVYDALTLIFALSIENFRQYHLTKVLNLHYQSFIDIVKKFDITVAKKFDLNTFENHVKVFLPVVKLEIAQHLTQQEKAFQEEEEGFRKLLNNISYSLKYPQISYEDCLEANSKKLGSTEFELVDYELVSLDEKNGHLGEYFNLKSKVNYSGKSQEISMFVKLLKASNDVLNAYLQPASEKEQFFFRTLIPLFKEYGLESIMDFAPNCYFDRFNDVMIQDNLAPLGYKPLGPDAKVGYDVLRSIFLKAARFHACSLLLENRMSKSRGTTIRLGDIYKEFFDDWLFKTSEGLPTLPVLPENSRPGVEELIDLVDLPQKISKEEFHKRVDAIYEVFTERLTSPASQFRNVVSHGDFYVSNILTKYDQNGVAENSFIIDYQALRYTPVTGDILFLVYCNAQRDVRDKYLNKLLQEYYQEMKKILLQFDEDINTFYTPEEFTECINYMKPIAIIAALHYCQVIGVPHEKREEVFFNEAQFTYYLIENRREYIKYLLSWDNNDYVSYVQGLVNELYDVCTDLY